LEMDEAGWVAVEELLQSSANHGRHITQDDISAAIAGSDKKRFSFSADRKFIRANYGHSVDINPDYEPEKPPDTLYHGTARRFLSKIRDEGLRSQNRQFVHLSTDKKSAREVGTRHGKPFILEIAAIDMYKDDYAFYLSDADIWLTKIVPVEYITFPRNDEY